MGQFAPVAPIQILEEMKKWKILGNYHLLLTHHVLEYPDRFRELFDGNFNAGTASTIFMDNSIVELGNAVSDERVFEACEVVKGRNWVYPVLIDVMGNSEATIEKSTASWEWWRTNHPEYTPLAVLQGDSWESFTRSADYFCLDPQFRNLQWVGIPRVLVKPLGSRMRAIQYVEAIRPDINVHLLGFSDDVCDDVICCNHPNVAGIDSAVPIRYSYSGGVGPYTPSSHIPARPADWFEKGEYDDSIGKNLAATRLWVA